jgi:hypothetical protein
MTRLDFAGDWSLPAAATVACVLATASFLLYRRMLGARFCGVARLLPLIRATVVALIVLMLGGPVLKHRRVRGTLTRLSLVFDGSLSMQLTDPQMPEARRARIAARLGWIPDGVVPPHLGRAEDHAARLRGFLQKIVEGARAGKFEEALFKRAAESAEALRKDLESTGVGRELSAKYEREVLEPLKRTASTPGDPGAKANQTRIERISTVGKSAFEEVEAVIRAAVLQTLEGNPAAKQAVERVGNTSRWQRIQTLLSSGADKGLLNRLRAGFDLRIRKIDGRSETLIAEETVAADPTLAYLGEPLGTCTDLGTALERDLESLRASGNAESTRSVTVLISDGQFNVGEPPGLVARRLGDRKSPVFTVGVGGLERSPDLAMQGLDAPMRAVPTDRIRGSLKVREDVAPGMEYSLRIRCGGAVIWEQAAHSGDSGTRQFPFEIALEPLLAARGKDLKSTQGLLQFDAEIVPFKGERETRNNNAKFTVQVIEKKRSILILDSEPRWDMRYLRNLFERDSQWEVNALIRSRDGDGSKSPWDRGERSGTYPSTREVLSKYEIVVLGDVPAAWLTPEETRHLSEHVAEAGAGLVLMEGGQGRLKDWLAGPLGAAFPVEYGDGDPFRGAEAWSLSKAGLQNPVLSLHAEPDRVAEVWGRLQVPKRVTRVRPGGGAEVLLSLKGAGVEFPFLVTRQFGAGKVVHLASDETWRWRLEVGGEHQSRFWNQLVSWVAETPFAAKGQSVSVDSDKPVYRPGEKARFRVKLSDHTGRPVLGARAKVSVFREGVRVSQLPLSAAPGRPGIYQAEFTVDAEGSFEVGVETSGVEAETVRARFEVENAGESELASLRMNEALLRDVAGNSGGTFLLEEELGRIEELIRPFSDGEVIETETVLWTSFGWLGAVVVLLSMEWVIRKRLGMI